MNDDTQVELPEEGHTVVDTEDELLCLAHADVSTNSSKQDTLQMMIDAGDPDMGLCWSLVCHHLFVEHSTLRLCSRVSTRVADC